MIFPGIHNTLRSNPEIRQGGASVQSIQVPRLLTQFKIGLVIIAYQNLIYV